MRSDEPVQCDRSRGSLISPPDGCCVRLCVRSLVFCNTHFTKSEELRMPEVNVFLGSCLGQIVLLLPLFCVFTLNGVHLSEAVPSTF